MALVLEFVPLFFCDVLPDGPLFDNAIVILSSSVYVISNF